jgi:hypothetical protein
MKAKQRETQGMMFAALKQEKDDATAEKKMREIEATLKAAGDKDVTVMRLPELNHLSHTSETGLPGEDALSFRRSGRRGRLNNMARRRERC